MKSDKFHSYRNPGNIKISQKMKAVVMSKTGLENLKVEEVDVPMPNKNQILVRVDACTICPSTLKLLIQGPGHTFLNGWDISKYPIILGDEGAVTAVKIGENLKGKYKVGEKLSIQPAVDHEPVNYKERYRNPELMKKLAVGYTLSGHLAEYLLVREEVLDANCLIKLPSQELGYYEISLGEPLSCVVSSQDHHVHFVIEPKTGERVPKKGLLKGGVTAVFGAGVMGRLHIELAITYRPRKIVVFDIDPEKFKWIEKYLYKRAKKEKVDIHCELANKGNVQENLYKLTGQNYADDIIDATSIVGVQETAFRLAGKGSVFNSFGGLKSGESVVGVDMRKVHYDESIITGSSGGNWADMRKSLGLVSRGSLQLGKYIRLVGDLNDAIEFLNLVNLRKIDGKAIVYPHTKVDKPVNVEDEWTKQKEIEFLNNHLAD